MKLRDQRLNQSQVVEERTDPIRQLPHGLLYKITLNFFSITVLLFAILLQSSIHAVDTKEEKNIKIKPNIDTGFNLNLNDLKLDKNEINRIKNIKKRIHSKHINKQIKSKQKKLQSKIGKSEKPGIPEKKSQEQKSIPNHYGIWIEAPKDSMFIGDFVDRDGDDIDDRKQKSPKAPIDDRFRNSEKPGIPEKLKEPMFRGNIVDHDGDNIDNRKQKRPGGPIEPGIDDITTSP